MNRTPCSYLFPEDSAHSSLDSASSIEFLHDQASFLLKSFINRLLSSTREAEEEIVSVRKHLTTALSTQRNHKQFQSKLLPLFPFRQPSLHVFLFFFSLCRLSPYLLYTKVQITSRYYEPPLSIVITSNPGNRKGKKIKIENSFLLQCSCKFASKKAPKNHRSFML